MSGKVLDMQDRFHASGGRKEERGSDARQIGTYSPKAEAQRILDLLLQLKQELQLPDGVEDKVKDFEFTTEKDQVYFPIPFKETETTAALKAVEALVASSIADLRFGKRQRHIEVNLEQTTCFLFQTYLATIDGLGKYSPGVKSKLKGKDSASCRDLVLL
jgi:hypothetical protein